MFERVKKVSLVVLLLLMVGCHDNVERVTDDINISQPVSQEEPPVSGNEPPLMLGDTPVASSESSEIPYSSIFSAVRIIGGLGYAIYKNDGDITTGLIMRTVNPTGYIANQVDIQTEMLKEMRDSLNDIIANILVIEGELSSISRQLKANQDELLNLIATPFDARTQIISAEQDFIDYTVDTGPNEANEEKMRDLYDLILDTHDVMGNINNIQYKITEEGAQILYTHTNKLIDYIGDNTVSLKNGELNRAYNSLEHYTYYWINTMSRGIDLVVEAYRAHVKNYDEDSIAQSKYKRFLEYVDNDLNNADEKYSFIRNVWRLVIYYTDPYDAHPDHDRHFLPDDAYKILKRAEFFRRVLTQQKDLGLIYYDIRTMQDRPDSLKAYSEEDGNVTECEAKEYRVEGPGYDMWQFDGDVYEKDSDEKYSSGDLSYDKTYRITLYNCPVGEGTYTLINDEGNIVKDNITVSRYNYDMQKDDEGDIIYGFALSSKRNSSQIEKLKWHVSSNYKGIKAEYELIERSGNQINYTTHSTYPDRSYGFKTTKNISAYPLELKMIFDRSHSSYKQTDMSKKPYHFFNDKLSIYKEFIYEGKKPHRFKLDTKYYRYYHVYSDGNSRAKTIHRMYVYDVNDSKTVATIFKGFDDLKEVHNDDIEKSKSDPALTKVYLKPGHKYRLYIHMAGWGEQFRITDECNRGGCSYKGYEFRGNIVIKQKQLRRMRLFY